MNVISINRTQDSTPATAVDHDERASLLDGLFAEHARRAEDIGACMARYSATRTWLDLAASGAMSDREKQAILDARVAVDYAHQMIVRRHLAERAEAQALVTAHLADSR